MSTRNFDSSTVIQRLKEKTYARNLYFNNVSGQRLINNPQNSNGDASQFGRYIEGAQTEYYKGLFKILAQAIVQLM